MFADTTLPYNTPFTKKKKNKFGIMKEETKNICQKKIP
jgi:hypothetical protein